MKPRWINIHATAIHCSGRGTFFDEVTDRREYRPRRPREDTGTLCVHRRHTSSQAIPAWPTRVNTIASLEISPLVETMAPHPGPSFANDQCEIVASVGPAIKLVSAIFREESRYRIDDRPSVPVSQAIISKAFPNHYPANRRKPDQSRQCWRIRVLASGKPRHLTGFTGHGSNRPDGGKSGHDLLNASSRIQAG